MPRRKQDTAKRTAEHLSRTGWIPWHVETGPKYHRRDMWGFADLAAYKPNRGGVLLVQSCARNHHKAMIDKCLAHPNARRWVQSPGRTLEVWSWHIDEGQPKVEKITIGMFCTMP